MFEEDALTIKAGEYYNLDLHPLVKVVFLEDLGPKEQEDATQDAGELLTLVEAFAKRLRQEPDMIDKIEFNYKFTRSE